MAAPNENPKQQALVREWTVARNFVIGGLVLAIAGVGYFAWRAHEAAEEQRLTTTAPIPKKIDAKALQRLEAAVCTAELIQAKNLGVVPSYGVLASPRLVRGDVPMRFICEAKTSVTSYLIAADLRCKSSLAGNCVSVYRVATKEGELVYARPD